MMMLPKLNLLLHSPAAGLITVGLNPPAAHYFPPPRINVPDDSRKERRSQLLDHAVGPRLCPTEDHVRICIELVTGAAAYGQHFIDTGWPRPQPDQRPLVFALCAIFRSCDVLGQNDLLGNPIKLPRRKSKQIGN